MFLHRSLLTVLLSQCVLCQKLLQDTVPTDVEFVIQNHLEAEKNETIKPLPYTNYDYSRMCGIHRGFERKDLARVVGGSATTHGEYPWQVSLQYRTTARTLTHFCGGAIINEYWIITAAHCVNSISPGIITVVAGDYNLYWNEGTEQSRHVAKIITNNFDAPTFTNDIALVKLSYPLDFFSSSAIAPLCLPYAFQKFQGNAVVVGWGRLTEYGGSPYVLHHAQLRLFDRDTCNGRFRNAGAYRFAQQCQMCAGEEFGGKDSCQGDSGGPLVCPVANGKYTLCGIVSWGIGCGRPQYFGVYTEVSCYMEWIQHVLQTE